MFLKVMLGAMRPQSENVNWAWAEEVRQRSPFAIWSFSSARPKALASGLSLEGRIGGTSYDGRIWVMNSNTRALSLCQWPPNKGYPRAEDEEFERERQHQTTTRGSCSPRDKTRSESLCFPFGGHEGLIRAPAGAAPCLARQTPRVRRTAWAPLLEFVRTVLSTTGGAMALACAYDAIVLVGGSG